jgi:AcrR family transcriptional regulator
MGTDSSTDDTRQRIIQAALQAFGETGYTRATTRAIAERAGVNEVTLFRHFGSKKNLLRACIQAGNEAGFSETFQAHLTGDYAADIHLMARLQRESTLRGRDILRLLICEAQVVAELQAALAQGAEGNRALLADYFRQQIDAGIVRADLDPLTLAYGFVSLFSSYVLFEQLMGASMLPDIPAEQVVDSLASVFIQGTLAEKGEQ